MRLFVSAPLTAGIRVGAVTAPIRPHPVLVRLALVALGCALWIAAAAAAILLLVLVKELFMAAPNPAFR